MVNHVTENILVAIVIILVIINITGTCLPVWRSRRHTFSISPSGAIHVNKRSVITVRTELDVKNNASRTIGARQDKSILIKGRLLSQGNYYDSLVSKEVDKNGNSRIKDNNKDDRNDSSRINNDNNEDDENNSRINENISNSDLVENIRNTNYDVINSVNIKTNDDVTINDDIIATASGVINTTRTVIHSMVALCSVEITIQEGLWNNDCIKEADDHCGFDENEWCQKQQYPKFNHFVISIQIFGDVMLLCSVIAIARARYCRNPYVLEMVGSTIGMGGILMALGVAVYATDEPNYHKNTYPENIYQPPHLHTGWSLCVGVATCSVILGILCMWRHVEETRPLACRSTYFPIHDQDEQLIDLV